MVQDAIDGAVADLQTLQHARACPSQIMERPAIQWFDGLRIDPLFNGVLALDVEDRAIDLALERRPRRHRLVTLPTRREHRLVTLPTRCEHRLRRVFAPDNVETLAELLDTKAAREAPGIWRYRAADEIAGAVPVAIERWPLPGDIREKALVPFYADVDALRRRGVPLIAWVAGNSLANLPAPSPGFVSGPVHNRQDASASGRQANRRPFAARREIR